MGKEDEQLQEELNAEKKALKEKFLRNVEYIKEIIPEFTISEDRIEHYITPERLEIRQKILAYNRNVEHTKSLTKGGRRPESFARCLFTFYDKSGTNDADEINAKLARDIGSPLQEGERVRKKAFIDALNQAQTLDGSKIRGDVSFDEKMRYVLDNRDVLERGFEFQRFNEGRKSSIALAFSDENEKNIKKIQDKSVVLGGVGQTLCEMAGTELFLTFPFEDLTPDQAAKLNAKIQRNLMNKGMSKDEAGEYSKFAQGILYMSIPVPFEEPAPHVFTEEDAHSLLPTLEKVESELTDAYGQLRNAASPEDLAADPQLEKMMDQFRGVVNELSRYQGSLTPAQAVYARGSFLSLRKAVFDCSPDGNHRKNLDENGRKRCEQMDRVVEALGSAFSDDLLCETMINSHNLKNGKEESAAYFQEFRDLQDKMRKSGATMAELQLTSAELGISPDELIRKASDGKISWKPTDAEIKKYLKEEAEREEQEALETIGSRYELTKEDEKLFRDAGIRPDELEALPFMQEAQSPEDRQKALRGYLDGVEQCSADNLSEEYAAALDEEGLTLDEIKSLAIRQGVSVDTYMDRLMGMEETANTQIDEAVEEINRQLRESAKSPLERLKADTLIEMKDASYQAGSRSDMEKSVAKYIAIKSLQTYVGVSNGEPFEEGSKKAEKFGKMVGNLQKYAEDVYNSDTFRYFIKKHSTEDLVQMTRAGSTEPLESDYKAFFRMMGTKAIHTDYVTVADRIKTYSACALDREGYLGEKVDSRGEFVPPQKNPFNLTVSRQAVVALAMGNMIQRGFELEDILDPFKLSQVKKEFGREAYDQVQENTPENREAITKSYLTLLDKSVALANRQVSKLDSLNPCEVAKMKELTFFATEGLLKDSLQELGTLRKGQPLSPENEARYQNLSKHADAVDKVYDAVKHSFDGIASITEKDAHPNPEDAMRKSLQGPYLNDAFLKTKADAQKNGITISEQMKRDHEAKPNDPATFLGACRTSPLCMMNFSLPQEVNSKMYGNKTLMDGLAKDIFDGNFAKQIFAKKFDNGTVNYNVNYIAKLADVSKAKNKEVKMDEPQDNLSLWF